MALRRHREEISSGNPGNFLALLKSYAEADDMLYAHLYKPRATHLSPTSQNQIINLLGHDIRANLIAEVKTARFFAVIADEVSSHNVEYLRLCLRFVDEKYDIHEEFVSFIKGTSN